MVSVVTRSASVAAWRKTFDTRLEDLDTWLYEELVDELSLVQRDSEEPRLTAELFGRLEGVPRWIAMRLQMLDDECSRFPRILRCYRPKVSMPSTRGSTMVMKENSAGMTWRSRMDGRDTCCRSALVQREFFWPTSRKGCRDGDELSQITTEVAGFGGDDRRGKIRRRARP